ncbi:MAG TPA: hypothetical protein VMT91_14680 [Anaerolineales bacterium]|nr:hypothetical protein [Anaerolineales bacterium]
MSRTLTAITTIVLIILTIAILGGMVWANTQYVRSQPAEKDFLVPWLAARTFIQYGDSPYSQPAAQRAQILYYGKLAAPGQDPLVLWLPFPFELFYFPIALINDYVLARAIWMVALEIALVILAFLSLELIGWKPGRLFLPVVLLMPLLWVYGAISLDSASAAGFIALALAGFLLALRSERDELAGGLLVLLVSSLRFSGVLAFFIFWWIFYTRRWRVLWGFLMGFAVLLGLSFLFLPGWFLPYLSGMISHSSFNPAFTSIGIFAAWSPVVGQRLGWLLAGILLLVLFFEWGNALSKGFRSFLWMVSLTISVTPLLGIPMSPKEYLILFVPLVLFLSLLSERRSWLKHWGVPVIGILIIGGSWLLTLLLIQAGAYTALANTLILCLPALLVIGLYWMRWWLIHTVPTGLESPP